VTFQGERAHEHPRRFVSMAIEVPNHRHVTDRVVERAIDLSREKYCSVWNSIRPDVELTTSFTIQR
jgi:putative redox protein